LSFEILKGCEVSSERLIGENLELDKKIL